jgi:hypothetical protein
MPTDNPLKGTPKKAWLIGGAVAAGVGIYVYWRNKNKAAAVAASPGYGYGASYGYGVTPIYGYGQGGTGLGFPYSGGLYGGGGYGGGPVPAPTTNAQWAAAVESSLSAQGYDTLTVAAALGKYLTGQTCTADQTSIIQAAIAFQGYPPQNGPDGYPPNIHTAGSGGGGNAKNPVTGLHQTASGIHGQKLGTTGANIAWNPSAGATGYQVTSTKGTVTMLGPTSARIHDIRTNRGVLGGGEATVTVLAEPAGNGAIPAKLVVHTRR